MSIKTLRLRNPLLINGEKRTELTYDIEELTVENLANAENYKVKLGGNGLTSGFAQADYLLHVCLGMQAIIVVNKDITEDDLKRLKKFDVAQLATIGMDFFLDPEESEQNISEKPQEVTQESSIAPSKSVTKPLS